MPNSVWVSSVMSDFSIGNKQGIREKYYGQNWAPPTFIFNLSEPENVVKASRHHRSGKAIERADFPEAMYVFDEKRWKRCGNLFIAGLTYAVKGKLAEVLKKFDLGEGGLIEFPIYEADKTTQLPGPFYFLNFGAIKDSFVPSESKKLYSRRTIENDGYELWATYKLEDGDITVTASALEGADLWFERKLEKRIFMSGRLHDAILAAKVKTKFQFAEAQIID
ncbi:hypothetical protein [Pseudochrobactrum asaccharolyticum]|uniref:hypothetical protein n=1 Tax=Pseudochrobactrum asaccharolyticum TaxID=354351 RepID=UPI004041CE21